MQMIICLHILFNTDPKRAKSSYGKVCRWTLKLHFFGACYWNPIDIKKRRLIRIIFAVSNSLASQCPRGFKHSYAFRISWHNIHEIFKGKCFIQEKSVIALERY